MTRRLGPLALADANGRQLDGYRVRYPAGWAASAGDPYLGPSLAGHLRAADREAELRSTLTDVAWIEARLAHGGA